MDFILEPFDQHKTQCGLCAKARQAARSRIRSLGFASNESGSNLSFLFPATLAAVCTSFLASCKNCLTWNVDSESMILESWKPKKTQKTVFCKQCSYYDCILLLTEMYVQVLTPCTQCWFSMVEVSRSGLIERPATRSPDLYK